MHTSIFISADLYVPEVLMIGNVAGVKRDVSSALDSFSKRARNYGALVQVPVLELAFSPKLSLPFKDGKLQVSPAKRKIGRPPGSKNKPKVLVTEEDSVGPRPLKKKYKYRRGGKNLVDGDNELVTGDGGVSSSDSASGSGPSSGS